MPQPSRWQFLLKVFLRVYPPSVVCGKILEVRFQWKISKTTFFTHMHWTGCRILRVSFRSTNTTTSTQTTAAVVDVLNCQYPHWTATNFLFTFWWPPPFLRLLSGASLSVCLELYSQRTNCRLGWSTGEWLAEVETARDSTTARLLNQRFWGVVMRNANNFLRGRTRRTTLLVGEGENTGILY